MKNVLIPTDFSKNSLNAVEYALNFFENLTCNFYFLHVVRREDLDGGEALVLSSTDVVEKVYLNPSIKKLKNIVQKLRITNNNKKHRLFTLIDCDYFVDSVRKHINEKQIDFIVMGTRGASGIKKMLVGSNTADVITKVKCTTLVIPENAKFKIPKEIVFPSDFSSSYAVESLDPLLEILKRFNSKIGILYVKNKKNEQLTYQQITNREFLIDYFSETELSFHYSTNKYLGDGIECFTNSREIQIITMVAKNLNYFHQILFRPTVEEVTYQTELPFLILHE